MIIFNRNRRGGNDVWRSSSCRNKTGGTPKDFEHCDNCIIFAIPRCGMVIGAEIAKRLHLTAIIVDDGIATGQIVMAAIDFPRDLKLSV
jgi:predicted phosphoribosyltransferase